MNKEKKRMQKYIGLNRVLTNHPSAFEGRIQATSARNAFSAKVIEISNLSAQLELPRSSVYQMRILQQSDLRNQCQNMIHIGIMLANRLQDQTMLNTLIAFSGRLRPGSAMTLTTIAQHVYNLLQSNHEAANELGLSDEMLTDFNNQTLVFEQAMTEVENQLDARRNIKINIKILLKECNTMLKLELDRFVLFNRAAYPDLYSSYMNLRRQQRSKGSGSENVADSDISGTITDAVTGLPILGAVMSFKERTDTTTTDSDGYFVLDELEAGTYTLNCQAPGYQSAEAVKLSLSESDSLVHNISLSPAA